MASDADLLIDRRRIRRKLTFWRIAALGAAALAIAALVYGIADESALGKSSSHIAKIRIEGTILENEELVERLEAIAESSSVKGVVLSIDSPGGTTAGGEMIFEAVRRVAEKKPVVAQIGTLAASGGYMVACGADHIVARKTSIVGSIGVLVQYPDLTGLMDKLGIKLESIKSSPLKAEPNPFNPTTEEERAVLRALILDTYEWFVDLVADRRPMSREDALKLANGAVFSGRQSVANKLIDSLGGEREAIEWLKSKGVDGDLKVIEWKRNKSGADFLPLASLTGQLAGYLGIAPGEAALVAAKTERILLDGLLSVWHPRGNAN